MRETVETLFSRYKDSLFQAAFSVLQNRADSEDAVQMTMIQYFSSTQEFENEDHIKKWLFRTVLNKAKDIRRTFWRRNRMPLDETLANIPVTSEADGRLLEAVAHLPARYRVVLQLYYYENFSTEEISRIIQISPAGVRKRLSRARSELKKILREDWMDEDNG